LENLSARNNKLKNRLYARESLLTTTGKVHTNLTMVVERNGEDIADFTKAIELCRACIEDQSDAKTHIENITSALLNTVMQSMYAEEDFTGDLPVYEYKLEPVKDNMDVVVGLKPTVLKNGIAAAPTKYGGGVRNLISFANRLVYLLLNPELTPVLFMDEALTNVSQSAWAYIVKFVEDLQKDIPLQVICITHSHAEFPKTLQVWKEGDVSRVREMVL